MTSDCRDEFGCSWNWTGREQRQMPGRDARMIGEIGLRRRIKTLPHQYPADRFIAATAIEMRMPLATADARLLVCAELRCC